MRSKCRAFLVIACILASFGRASGQDPKIVYHLREFGTAQKLLRTSAPADPLPPWNDATTKKAFIDFVKIDSIGASTKLRSEAGRL